MTITLPTPGQLNWGQPLNRALTQIGSGIAPDDHNFESWTFDPVLTAGQTTTVNGTLLVGKIPIRQSPPAQLVRMEWAISGTPATAPVAGQNWIGVYSSAGVRLSQAGVDGIITTTGVKTVVLPGFMPAAPFVWAAMLFNAATPPQIVRSPSTATGTPNMGTTAATTRFGVAATAQTALPASITPGSIVTTGAITFIAGLGA